MVNRLFSLSRRLMPLVGAGVLLQAGGCQVATQDLAVGLTSTILTNLVTSWVFGVFNLGTF